jgi:hypothetical protein
MEPKPDPGRLMPEANVANCATEIRRIFGEMKREQTGKPYRPAPRNNKMETWLAAAEHCIQLETDPYSYVHAAFHYGSNIPGGPFANQLATSAARRWFLLYQKANSKKTAEVVLVAPKDPFRAAIEADIRSAFEAAAERRQRVAEDKRRGLSIIGPVTWDDFWLDDGWNRLDQIPAYIRVILNPGSAEILKKFGRKAYQEINGNQRLLNLLLEIGYNLDFLVLVKQGKI